MKPAVWRIFRNNRWSYSDTPSTRSDERAAWQPLYAVPKKEWVGLTDEEIADAENFYVEDERALPYSFARAIEAKLKAKNA